MYQRKESRAIEGLSMLMGFRASQLADACGIAPRTWSTRMQDPDSFTIEELRGLAVRFGYRGDGGFVEFLDLIYGGGALKGITRRA